MTTTTPRPVRGRRGRALLAVSATLAATSGCGGGDASGRPSTADAAEVATAESRPTGGAVDDGGVFTPETVTLLDAAGYVDVPGGGRAAAGIVCRGDGGDVAYVGVSGVEDGLYTVVSDGVPGQIGFTTGSPSTGRGAGAYQTTLEDETYTFSFESLGVDVRVPGCR